MTPLYEYECEKCGRFEKFTRRQEADNKVQCPTCKGNVIRVFSPVNFTFGWTLSDESRWVKGVKDTFVRNV